jgi:hypothetical protein
LTGLHPIFVLVLVLAFVHSPQLAAKSFNAGGTTKNYYCGDFVYDGSLAVAYILTPNGQLTRNPTTGAYTTQYNIPDHLGNVRSVVSSGGTVLQSTDYYPFGLAFADDNIASNRYLYNGKELEDYTLGTAESRLDSCSAGIHYIFFL